MSENLRDRLKAQIITETGPAGWKVLRAHIDRGGVIIVGQDLELVEAGVAVAQDDTESVQHWITAGQLTRPTPEQVTVWQQGTTTFRCLILQPYVLVQPQEGTELLH